MAEEGRFGVEWERPASGPILAPRTRAAAIDSHEAAVAWLKSRLLELAESRVLEPLVLGHEHTPPSAG
jgi:hypothetical protein